MHLAFLLDEDTEKTLARHLERDGHDVERVVAVDTLGSGTPDADICQYALRTDRIIITHDEGYKGVPNDEHAGLIWLEEQRLSAFEHYRIVSAIVDQFPDRASLDLVVNGTTAWL